VSVSDLTSPTSPTHLSAVAASLSELDLSWTVSTDNVGVSGYKIFRAGFQIATSTFTSYADTGLTASTTYTYTVKAFDAAGNVSSASNIATSTTGTWADGFAAAPSGTPQLPSLLQGYAARTPWRAAGVDYAVGITPGTTLTDWQSLAGTPGIDLSGNAVRCQGTFAANPSGSATINGVDFTLHGGAFIYIASGGCSSLSITNSKFSCNTTTGSDFYYVQSQNNMNLTIKNNEVDGQGCEIGQLSFLSTAGSGTTTLEYNYFNNLIDHLFEQNSGTTAMVYKYNLVNNFNPSFDTSNHMNFLQQGSGTTTPDVEFNTVYIPGNTVGVGGEVFQYYFNGAGTTTNPINAYNTVIGLPPGPGDTAISYAIHGGSAGTLGTTALSGTGTNVSNYFDVSGMFGAYYPGSMVGWTSIGNINMSTGATITPP
jgi:hypothetical protein